LLPAATERKTAARAWKTAVAAVWDVQQPPPRLRGRHLPLQARRGLLSRAAATAMTTQLSSFTGSNPVTVMLTIGDDSGTTSIKAKISGREILGSN
jgi:3,4-dihydroxy-2-butanone 4-phosphate synthase